MQPGGPPSPPKNPPPVYSQWGHVGSGEKPLNEGEKKHGGMRAEPPPPSPRLSAHFSRSPQNFGAAPKPRCGAMRWWGSNPQPMSHPGVGALGPPCALFDVTRGGFPRRAPGRGRPRDPPRSVPPPREGGRISAGTSGHFFNPRFVFTASPRSSAELYTLSAARPRRGFRGKSREKRSDFAVL